MADPLEAGGWLLRAVRLDDAEAFRRVMSGPDMGAHTDVPWRPSPKRAAGFVAWMIKLTASGKGRAWAITDGPEVLGFIRMNRIDPKLSLAVVGYEVAQDHWGKGVGTAALHAVVAHGHDDLGLNRLEGWVLGGNTASLRVMEKAGFLLEGTRRQRVLLHKELRDEHLFRRLAGDPRP